MILNDFVKLGKKFLEIAPISTIICWHINGTIVGELVNEEGVRCRTLEYGDKQEVDMFGIHIKYFDNPRISFDETALKDMYGHYRKAIQTYKNIKESK